MRDSTRELRSNREHRCPQQHPGGRSRWLGIRLFFASLIGLLWMIADRPASAWGPTAHRMVVSWAIQTLPPDIRGFFEANHQYLLDHANDPDEWMKKDPYERSRHYIYLDKYGFFPYLKLPHSFRAAAQQYGKGHLSRYGLLPWRIGEYSLRLTNDFKGQKWDDARLDAAVLAHYVADAHDPLHTTQNYNGQLTDQTGVEARFDAALVDRYTNFFMFHPEAASKIADPTEYAFDMVLEANTWVDRILLEDRRALDGLPGYNEDYFDRFYSQIGTTAMRELNAAAHDTGCYWYTAWLNAGRPQIPTH